jgi:chemotaxis protein MotC
VRLAAKLSGAAIGAALAAGAAYGQDGKGEPFELVRSLQSLQDQVVKGSARAHAEQRVLLERIAEQFELLSSERWQDPKNVRAAVVFVLSGGGAHVLQKPTSSDGGRTIDPKLLKGSLAYAEGRVEEAAEMLGAIDARALDPGLAGHVAYVQGELAAKKEPAKALAHFDDARLLSPGTIIEEAALRRQVALLAAAGNDDRYEALAAQYMRRFPNSVYARGFREQLATGIAASKNASRPGRFAHLESLLGSIQQPDRREIFLAIAKEAISKGRVEMARFAAAHAMRLSDEHSAERERAQLYEAAALIVTEDFEQGVTKLGALDRSKLPDADAALLDAALAIATQVRRHPETPTEEPPAGDGRLAHDIGPALQHARSAIAKVDALLSRAER